MRRLVAILSAAATTAANLHKCDQAQICQHTGLWNEAAFIIAPSSLRERRC